MSETITGKTGRKVHVVVVAAGKGSRFGGDLPKQFSLLGDRPVLMHTVIRLARSMPAANITIVLSEAYVTYWERMCEIYGFVSPRVVVGGETRWESVRNAVNSLGAAPDDIIMVHDGVRPMVETKMMHRILDATKDAAAVIPVVPLTDSLRELDGDTGSHAIDRSQLVAVQTPQAFRAENLLEAYKLDYRPEFTDDASVYEAAGYGSPTLVDGSSTNIKITRPRDIDIAALFMGIR